jgi:hypothetical protein
MIKRIQPCLKRFVVDALARCDLRPCLGDHERFVPNSLGYRFGPASAGRRLRADPAQIAYLSG